jgi:hypothetical protein
VRGSGQGMRGSAKAQRSVFAGMGSDSDGWANVERWVFGSTVLIGFYLFFNNLEEAQREVLAVCA